MNAIRPNPKQHHYVPKFYLKRFTDKEGFLHIYDKERSHVRRQKPEKVMSINKYYRQEWVPAGLDVNIFESSLGAGLENRVPKILDKISYTDDTLTESEAVDFMVYIELQRFRVPRQANAGLGFLRDMIYQNLPKSIGNEVNSGQMQLTMKDSTRFDFMRMSIGSILPSLAHMEWEVVEAETGSSFLTSDSPVCFYNPKILPPFEAGIRLAGTKVLFPLSSSHLLLMRYPECRKLDLLTILPEPTSGDKRVCLKRGEIWSASVVARTNLKIAVLAEAFVVANNLETIQLTH